MTYFYFIEKKFLNLLNCDAFVMLALLFIKCFNKEFNILSVFSFAFRYFIMSGHQNRSTGTRPKTLRSPRQNQGRVNVTRQDTISGYLSTLEPR